MEPVLHVVEVADLEVAVHGVELLRPQQQVLDLRPAGPLDPDVEPAPGQGLRHDGDQAGPVAEHLLAVQLDHDAQDVLPVQEDRRRIGERQLPGRDGP
jgi:hypothetical protein